MRQKSPFPGMDPFLEHPSLWPGVHQGLITYARDLLQPRLGTRYYAEMGERLYVEGPDRDIYPDVAIFETREGSGPAPELDVDSPVVLVMEPIERREVFLENRDARSQDRIVTVIEVLFPSNKASGAAHELYLAKQRAVLASRSHLVEIDLLRAGQTTVSVPESQLPRSAYRGVVSRAQERDRREVYRFGLQTRLPRIAIPLVPPDPDVRLDLQAVFDQAYANGVYGRRIDYRGTTPIPPLLPPDHEWAESLLAAS